jgi:hypothetical protein
MNTIVFLFLFSEQLDQNLATSRRSLEETEFLGKSNHRAEESAAIVDEAVNVFGNKSKEKMPQRKHQQADKKKKKKQRQKEKLKTKEEKETPKMKVKGKEEITREELQKAGALPPANAMFKGSAKGKTLSETPKETSKVKSYWTEISEGSPRSKIKGNSLQYLDSADSRDRNQNKLMNSDRESKVDKNKELPIKHVQKERHDHMSSIDSAIAYLSGPEHLAHLSADKLPSPTKSSKVPGRFDWHQSLKDDVNVNPVNSWSKPSVDWRNNRYNWFGSFRNSKPDQDLKNSHTKLDEWAKFSSGSESTYRERDRNDLEGMPYFSGSLGKEDLHDSGMPDFSESRDKGIPKDKAYTWNESRISINSWPDMNPKEERRYYSGDPVYNSPNTGWPRFSVESLKHGNLAGNVKTWPPIDQSMGSNKDGYSLEETSNKWPNLPLETHLSIQSPNTYSRPNYSDDNTNRNSIIANNINAWTKPSLDPSLTKQSEVMTNTWSQIQSSHQKPLSSIDSAIAHHTKEASSSKQWPHFAYHRVTSSPQILAQQQKEAQQRARHRNAYIAVSVIAPPGKNKGLNKTQSRSNDSLLQASENAQNKVNEPPVKPSVAPLPDKMDQLLSMQSENEEFPDGGNLLEEQLVDMAVAGQQQRAVMSWSHARHLDKIQVWLFLSLGTVYSTSVLELLCASYG